MQHVAARGLFVAFLFTGATAASADVTLPHMFADNMVLQRSSDVAVWGWASPGEEIRISADWNADGALARVTAGPDGSWRTDIATPGAGGPYTLSVAGDNTVTFSNILIGEVWICSGQSNMEWSVARANDAQVEIAAGDHPEIRLFTVPNTISLHERSNCNGTWSVCSPETVSSFSAVGYYFGRELNRELGVPIGLISADWGGTLAEAWTSERVIRTMPDFADAIDFIEQSRDPTNRISLTKANLENWWNRLDNVGNARADRGWKGLNFDDSAWGDMTLPATFTQDGLDTFDGVFYFRCVVDLPDSWTDGAAKLELGPIDDYDDTWINGTRVGMAHEPGMWATPRVYNVAKGVLKPGKNIITIRGLDTNGIAGINGRPDQMKLSQGDNSISLARTWRYRRGSTNASLPARPESPRITQNTPTALYNGMIAPVIPYTLRGAIWYQGESNRNRGAQYRTLFPAMIRNWREDWGMGEFPFYFVQIAPFRYGGDTGQASELREAQFMTLSSPNTGMVVTTDIGNPADIHPRNKQEVGRRLSLWALAKDYGRDDIVFSGPLYESTTANGSEIRVSFSHTAEGLIAKDGPLTHFTIAGEDKNFVAARARIDGRTVVVSSDEVPHPVAVRFGWGATDEPNLFNTAGLPASIFRTDDWD